MKKHYCLVSLASVALLLMGCSESKLLHLRVDCGSREDYKDKEGNVWIADAGFEGGSFADPAIPFKAVQSTGTPVIYQTERYSKQDFHYKFAVPNGKYKVVLKMAEVWFQRPGERAFSVEINGKRELDKFDTIAQASGHHVAIDKEFVADVEDGTLVLRFVPEMAEAKINALEIIQM